MHESVLYVLIIASMPLEYIIMYAHVYVYFAIDQPFKCSFRFVRRFVILFIDRNKVRFAKIV